MPRGRQPEMSDSDLINVFKSSDEHVLKAQEIAEKTPIDEKQVNNRLKKLAEDRILEYKDAGSGRVWWLNRDPSGQ